MAWLAVPSLLLEYVQRQSSQKGRDPGGAGTAAVADIEAQQANS
jgi:hypothetical protein